MFRSELYANFMHENSQHGSVTDIDECNHFNVCDGNADCENTDGSFNCVCKLGFMISRNGQSCEGKALLHTNQS